MRIYMVGSHSVGKSTLARYVSEKYNVPMITEVARQVLSEKELNINLLRTNLDVVDDYQSSIFYRQLEEEKKHTNFVSDRSFDCLAYSAQHSRILPELLSSCKLNDYLTSLRLKDSFIFYVKPCKATLRDDGVRESLTWDGVIAIDAMIKLFLNMWELPHIQINTGSMQERVQLIDTVLKKSNM